jgi:hypothetical protein
VHTTPALVLTEEAFPTSSPTETADEPGELPVDEVEVAEPVEEEAPDKPAAEAETLEEPAAEAESPEQPAAETETSEEPAAEAEDDEPEADEPDAAA